MGFNDAPGSKKDEDEGRITDPKKARAMADAENPYRRSGTRWDRDKGYVNELDISGIESSTQTAEQRYEAEQLAAKMDDKQLEDRINADGEVLATLVKQKALVNGEIHGMLLTERETLIHILHKRREEGRQQEADRLSQGIKGKMS